MPERWRKLTTAQRHNLLRSISFRMRWGSGGVLVMLADDGPQFSQLRAIFAAYGARAKPGGNTR
jgi:hypothetical protein